MYANLALSVYLSMQMAPGTVGEKIHPVPVVVEVQTEDEGKGANVKVGKRVVVLAQVNEEEEEREGGRDPERGNRERDDREDAFKRRVRERAAEFRLRQEGQPERRRVESDRADENRRRADAENRGWGPQVGQMDIRLREQTERIERLEGAVRRLHEAVERLQVSQGARDVPRISDRRDQPVEGRPTNPEARVRALEQALGRLKERASGGAEDERSRQMRRAVEARAEAERLNAERGQRYEEARRRIAETAGPTLADLHAKRERAKHEYEQQRETIARQMRQAMERLEQNFKASDAEMEKAIADLEKKIRNRTE